MTSSGQKRRPSQPHHVSFRRLRTWVRASIRWSRAVLRYCISRNKGQGFVQNLLNAREQSGRNDLNITARSNSSFRSSYRPDGAKPWSGNEPRTDGPEPQDR
jgi:hypothetical protein